MKHKEYRLNIEAVIQSLHDALMVPRDYTAAVTRLTNTINRLPKGRIQIIHSHNGVSFYLKDKYLRKRSELVYSLARKRYCETVLQVITSDTNREEAFETLEELIRDFALGNLNLARILLTSQQYKWFFGRYEKKPFVREQTAEVLTIPQGDTVRSKSEQRIGIELHNYAAPCHYEEELYLNVQKLVRSLISELRERNQLPETLYAYQGYTCVWNVPAELSWMNAPGSIWRSYDDRTGCVQLYPDYTIMLADGSLLYWEHEGVLYQFRYRKTPWNALRSSAWQDRSPGQGSSKQMKRRQMILRPCARSSEAESFLISGSKNTDNELSRFHSSKAGQTSKTPSRKGRSILRKHLNSRFHAAEGGRTSNLRKLTSLEQFISGHTGRTFRG